MDISTISRATNDKFVQLPWGCFELKGFFSEGIMTKNGDIVSNTVVKKHIKNIIDNEDKSNPLIDEALTKMLLDKDYIIARRTVTKYREVMKIPAARLRKNNT
jgi:RNA polymerase sigma-54 factor